MIEINEIKKNNPSIDNDSKNPIINKSTNKIDELEYQAEKHKFFFGSIRIAPSERLKFSTISIIFATIIFIYSLMREFKDAFMLENQPLVSIYYMKMIVIPIIVLIVMAIIQKLYFYHSNDIILKYTFLGSSLYFFFYGSFIFPFKTNLEPHILSEIDIFSDNQMDYKGVSWIYALMTIVFRWTSSLHFIIAELWGSTVLSVLFMTFVNDICHIQQFMRFLPLLTVVGNVGRIISALFTFFYGNFTDNFSFETKNLITSIFFIIFGFLSFSMFLMMRFLLNSFKHKENLNNDNKGLNNDNEVDNNDNNAINNNGLNKFEESIEEKNAPLLKKETHGFLKSLKIISESKFAMAMCFLVLPYNIIVCMIEALQKASMKACAAEKNIDIVSHVLSIQWFNQFITALLLMVLLLSPFQRLIEHCGWLSMAIIPPIFSISTISILSLISFMNTCSKEKCCFPFLIPIGSRFHKLFSVINVEKEQWLATIALTTFKVLKYGPFDLSKDTIGRRIDDKYRARLRGVYDGICGNLGKSLGSVLTVVISYFLGADGDIREAAIVYLGVSLIMVCLWVVTVVYLNKKYRDAVEMNLAINLD